MITKAEDLNAETWTMCNDLTVYGSYFANRRLCPMPPDDRKFRLMTVAALRAVWSELTDPRSRTAVEVAERYADDYEPDPLEEADEPAFQAVEEFEDEEEVTDAPPSGSVLALAAWRVREGVMLNDDSIRGVAYWAWIVGELETASLKNRTTTQAKALHLRLFHDIFANTFRPVAFDPAWLTSDVVALAEGIYQERAFDRLPILADALQDAGCSNTDVLNHCRSEGPHCRGCWLIDTLTGRK